MEFLGPLVWTISGAMSMAIVLGPAFRKTVPIVLFLGVICIRDGIQKESNTKEEIEEESLQKREELMDT
jgi:uncharacterized protein YaaW (UPF0174 family)